MASFSRGTQSVEYTHKRKHRLLSSTRRSEIRNGENLTSSTGSDSRKPGESTRRQTQKYPNRRNGKNTSEARDASARTWFSTVKLRKAGLIQVVLLSEVEETQRNSWGAILTPTQSLKLARLAILVSVCDQEKGGSQKTGAITHSSQAPAPGRYCEPGKLQRKKRSEKKKKKKRSGRALARRKVTLSGGSLRNNEVFAEAFRTGNTGPESALHAKPAVGTRQADRTAHRSSDRFGHQE